MPVLPLRLSSAFGLVVFSLVSAIAVAQAPGRVLTDADYHLAESRLSAAVNPLVAHTVRRISFLPGNKLWYRDGSPERATYVLVDPATKTVAPAFDQLALAQAVAAAMPALKTPLDPVHLQLESLDLEADSTGHATALRFLVEGKRLRCTLGAPIRCQPDPHLADQSYDAHALYVTSPDGTKAAFIRDGNLWLHDVKSGAETALTRDGTPDFGYATDNAGWIHSRHPVLVWSPDSKRIATFQQDQRRTGMMYLVPVTNRHPELDAWRYPLVGDKDVTTIERVIINVPSGKVVRLKMPPDQHRSSICDDVSCGGGWDDVQWSPDAKTLAFVSTARDHKQEWLRVADANNGNVREVYTESAPNFLEAGYGRVNWRYLPESNEFLWFSERSGWGQMYLYDLATGKEKNAITRGDGNVTQVLSVDTKARRILYLAVGKDSARDPYFVSLHAVAFSGENDTLLTPENANHAVTLSEDASTFVDVASTPVTPQVTTLRDTKTGATIMPVAQQDISALAATGWKPPVPFTVKGRDNTTDLYGYIFRPTHFDPSRKYPLIDYIYPGPQGSSCNVDDRGFAAAHGDNQALAELGFIVICLDGMGTALRSKAFHAAYYGDLADNTLPDQVSGIRQLAARYPWIDLDRIGIWGHSGGGAATGAAMLHYPDFFKVGISESGNHDERTYEDDWAEKWAGLEQTKPDGSSNYDSQANAKFAANLKGHLLLAHGTMDDNVPMNNTLTLVDALIKANKDFDLVLIPNAHHAYGTAGPYMMRRRWDYFTRYLVGATPPNEYKMPPYAESVRKAEGP